MPRKVFSTEDARRLAKRRLPRLVFDFVDGAAGREVGARRNEARFDDIFLQPRVMADVAERSLKTAFLGQEFDLPVGIAPMGMCDLVCPGADRMLAGEASARGIPVCVSSAASTTLEDMRHLAGSRAWFQLYFGQSAETTLAMADRAREAGYDTLILTVDVPQVSRRVRDQRNGFDVPFRLTPTSFLDFATHPRWSLSTLAAGIPAPRNMGSTKFVRGASRAGANWDFLEKLRERWKGTLIVKGVTAPEDALRVRDAGADAIYVSNHGGRQLDGVPASIDLLPRIRAAVGPGMPLAFDSGVRNGEDVVKALAFGADLVMLGRPVLFALGAGGRRGLSDLLDCFGQDIDVAIAQLGIDAVSKLGSSVVFEGAGTDAASARQPLRIAAST